MPDILHDFPVLTTREKAFEAVSTPAGLEKWWTRTAAGEPRVGAEWELFFDTGFDWRARVLALEPDRLIEWEITRADADWMGTRVTIDLTDHPGGLVWVRFAHTGWRVPDEHFRISNYCWAMYLRLLKHWLQRGETVPYDRRLEI